MADTAAFLVDHVIPAEVPVRQWVLSLPYRVRLSCAHDVLAAVRRILVPALDVQAVLLLVESLPELSIGRRETYNWPGREVTISQMSTGPMHPRLCAPRLVEALADTPALQAAMGKKISAGVVLFDGETSAAFGAGLHAVPVRALWEDGWAR